MSKTHVSIGGCLYRVVHGGEMPSHAVYIGVGRLVNPNGFYVDAPCVSLYRVGNIFMYHI